MRSKLLRFGLISLVIFGVLLSLGENLNSLYKIGGEANEVRSLVLSTFLVLGVACLVLFFVKSILWIVLVLLLAGALFFLLQYGFEQFLG